MAIQLVNVGSAPNDGTGDFLRDAYIKINNSLSFLDSAKSRVFYSTPFHPYYYGDVYVTSTRIYYCHLDSSGSFQLSDWTAVMDFSTFTTDHGSLTGLSDDDHTQYYNQARGDARYSQLSHMHTGVYSPIGHNHSGVYEPVLGNPAVDGYILSSTAAGVRSWIAPPTGGGSMVYPSAGIPVSTGITWAVSLSATNLTSLAALTYSSEAFVKMTAAGTFSLDTTAYATAAHTHTNYVPTVPTAVNNNFAAFDLVGNIKDSGYNASSFEATISKSTGYLYYTGTAWSFKNESYMTSIVGGATGDVLMQTASGGAISAGFAASDVALIGHAHSAADITSGTLDNARLDSDLAAIGNLTGLDGLLLKAGGIWSLDTTGYQSADPILTGITTGLAGHTGGPHVVTISGASTFSWDATGYQAAHANLTSLSALSYSATAFVKMTAANTFALDTQTYIPTVSGSFTGYLPTITASGTLIGSPYLPTDFASSTHNHSGVYQPIDSDLTAIAALSGDGFLKKTTGIWGMDTNTYITGITKSMVEAVLTGTITSHNHSGTYEPALGSSSTAYLLQSSGTTRTWVSKNSIYTAFQTLTSGSTVTWNMNNGYNAKLTLGTNATLSVTNVADGMSGCLIVTQDATGARTLTLPTGSVVIGGGLYSLSTGAGDIDILTFVYTGSTYYWSIGKNYLGPV